MSTWCINSSDLSGNKHNLYLPLHNAHAPAVWLMLVRKDFVGFASSIRYSDLTGHIRNICTSVGRAECCPADYSQRLGQLKLRG